MLSAFLPVGGRAGGGMGEISLGRPLRAAASVSLAVLAASCGGSRNDAAPVIMNGAIMNGAGPDRIETAPVAPLAGTPLAPPRLPPRAAASRPPTPSGP